MLIVVDSYFSFALLIVRTLITLELKCFSKKILVSYLISAFSFEKKKFFDDYKRLTFNLFFIDH